jgi:hypothetical protein
MDTAELLTAGSNDILDGMVREFSLSIWATGV